MLASWLCVLTLTSQNVSDLETARRLITSGSAQDAVGLRGHGTMRLVAGPAAADRLATGRGNRPDLRPGSPLPRFQFSSAMPVSAHQFSTPLSPAHHYPQQYTLNFDPGSPLD